jgi:hypothetical protein
MDRIVVFGFVTTVQWIGQHFGISVLIQRIVRSIGTTASQGTRRNDGSGHNGCNHTGRQAANNRTQTSKAVQRGIHAARRARIGVAEGQRAVVVAWTHNRLLEALRVHWRHWIAIAIVAHVRQIGTQRRTIDVVAGTSARVTEVISTAIVVIAQSGWQVLATSLTNQLIE